jgi:hypothetical protein
MVARHYERATKDRVLEVLAAFDAPLSTEELAQLFHHKRTNVIERQLNRLAAHGDVVRINGGWRAAADVELDIAQEAATILARFYARAGDQGMAQLMELERERLNTDRSQ